MHLCLGTVPGNVVHIDPDGPSTLGIRPCATGGNSGVSYSLEGETFVERWILCQVTYDVCDAFPHGEILIGVAMVVHVVEVQVALVRALEEMPTVSGRFQNDPEIGIAWLVPQVRQ